MWRRTDLASYRSGSPAWEEVLSIDALCKAEGESWVYKGHVRTDQANLALLILSPVFTETKKQSPNTGARAIHK